MPGREKFKLLKLLGTGGFAHTYQAEVLDGSMRARWGKQVALKIPLTKEKEEVLIREIITNAYLHNCLLGLQDPYIVRYLDFARFDDQYVMVMEFIPEGSLRNRLGELRQQKALAIEEALEFTEQVCKGLVKIHQLKIYHRDLKPENILLASKIGPAKISDFGIGKKMTSADLAQTATGTYHYMPKELVRGKGGHFYSDIYSLGVTCYEMITGRVPFDGESLGEIIENICSATPKQPRELNARVDEELNRIVLKAMARDFRHRYQTAGELLRALQAYRRGGAAAEKEMAEMLKAARASLEEGGRPEEAVKKLTPMLKKYPDHEKAYLTLGDFYFTFCADHKKAVSVLRAGLERFPESAVLHRNLGLFLHKQSLLPEALRELEEAQRLAPNKEFAARLRPLLQACRKILGDKGTA